MSVSRRCTDLSTPFSTLFHPPPHLSHHRDKSERATSNAQIKRRRGSLVEYIQTGNQTGGDVFSFFFFFMNLVAEHKRVTSRRAVFIRAGRYPFRENPAAFIPRWKFSLSRASFHRVNDSRECKTKFKIFPLVFNGATFFSRKKKFSIFYRKSLNGCSTVSTLSTLQKGTARRFERIHFEEGIEKGCYEES